MRRSSMLIEAAVATAMIFVLFFIISFFPFRFELIKPIRQGLNDFDIYDLYFSGKNKFKNTRDSNIVIVEVAETRNDIARQLAIIKKHKPAVIGMDIVLRNSSENPRNDSLLKSVVGKSDSIIWAGVFEPDSTGKHFTWTKSFFAPASDPGKAVYINFPGDPISVTRTFSPFMKINDANQYSFASGIVQLFKPDKFEKLKKRNKKTETIYYSGNLESFHSFSVKELFEAEQKNFLSEKIRNKIVLLGFFKKDSPPVMEDLHFTPLNEKISGRSFPDMYGVVIHANIISMILNEKYIKTKSNSFAIILAILLSYIFVLYILSRHKVKEHPSHGLFILLQIILVVILVYLFLLLFAEYRIKINPMPVILTIVLSVEMIGLYKRLAKWLNKKWGYRTVFVKSS